MRCWEEEASERPTFDEIGAALRQMLNIEDEYYGYVTLENPKSVRYMLNREVSFGFPRFMFPFRSVNFLLLSRRFQPPSVI